MRWLARPTGLGLLLGLVAGSSCIELNPNHCANSGIDCGAGLVCDRCSAVNDGCVALDAVSSEPGCGPGTGSDTAWTTGGHGSEGTTDPIGAESSSSDGGEVGSDGDADTGPGPECTTADGTIDPDCPADAPYCVEQSCQSCDQLGGDAWCSSAKSELPVCDTDRCVECTSANNACSGTTPVCTEDNVCVACVEHEDCGEALGCDLDTGACFPADEVYIVQRDASNCPAGGDGTQGRPFCSLQEARDEITSDTYTIVLRGTADSYSESVTFIADTVAILGVDVPVIDGVENALSATSAARLFVDGVEISGSNGDGISCNNAYLWVGDSVLASNFGRGIDALNCPVSVRRTQLRGNVTGGISITDQPLVVQNSFITLNGSGGSEVSGVQLVDAEASIVYASIANNNAVGSEGDAMTCTGTVAATVRNSIVWAEDTNESIACSSGQLTMEHSVTDDSVFTGDTTSNTLLEVQPGAFVDFATGNLRVTSMSPFADLAQWSEGDPRTDIDGDPRPQPGPADDYVGADVPSR